MVVVTRLLPPGACAFTAWPFVFVHPIYVSKPAVMLHERVHLEQQQRWAIYGLGVGLLIWFLLYLLVLPAGWNPWRARWEAAAMRAEGRQDAEIAETLKHKPYYLWWYRG